MTAPAASGRGPASHRDPARPLVDACDRCLALSALTVALAKVPRFAEPEQAGRGAERGAARDAAANRHATPLDEASELAQPVASEPNSPRPPRGSPSHPAALARLLFGVSAVRRRSVGAAFDDWQPGGVRAAALDAGLAAWCWCAPGYPDALRELHDPPPVLYVRGNAALLAHCPSGAAAVVGTRHPTRTGRDAATRLAGAVGLRGGLVVSGMALGIDAAAHEGALGAGAPTIAVLASGADRPSPPSHRHLYDRILDAGAVVSEMPPGTRPLVWGFPARNRLIAALSQLTLVVEAPARSGALITAEQATDLGREVLAVPGPVGAESCRGSNLLLQEGCGAVVEGDHLAGQLSLPETGGAGRARWGRFAREGEDAPARRVAAVLEAGPMGLAQLGRATQELLGPGELELALLELEACGVVDRGVDGRYRVA